MDVVSLVLFMNLYLYLYVIVTLTNNVFNPNVCLCISYVLALFIIFYLKCQRTTHISNKGDCSCVAASRAKFGSKKEINKRNDYYHLLAESYSITSFISKTIT